MLADSQSQSAGIVVGITAANDPEVRKTCVVGMFPDQNLSLRRLPYTPHTGAVKIPHVSDGRGQPTQKRHRAEGCGVGPCAPDEGDAVLRRALESRVDDAAGAGGALPVGATAFPPGGGQGTAPRHRIGDDQYLRRSQFHSAMDELRSEIATKMAALKHDLICVLNSNLVFERNGHLTSRGAPP
jgi:hypothetical protein